MKLSEAMMLASTLGEKPLDNWTWDHCLLGLSCHAIGIQGRVFSEALLRWPWLRENQTHPEIHCGWKAKGYMLLTSLAEQVIHGEMSVHRAAEIVAEIEPAEPEVGEVKNEQTDGRQVPIPKPSLEATEV